MDTYTSDPQTRKRKIECKPELVISSLQRFYSSHPEIEKVLTYLTGDAPLSLRIIDWFVTKYSRKSFVRYPLNGQDFLVYLSYKGQLKAYSKQYFDPNCRRERIMFKIPGQEQFMTTIGKLNFFRWALESKILEYIEAHEEEIRTGYNSYLKDTTQTQKRVKNETASSTDSNISSDSVQSSNTITTQATQVSQASQASQGTQSSSGSQSTNSSARTTRRRRTKQSPSSLNKLQVYTTPIELGFD
jgi:hypothetical protein